MLSSWLTISTGSKLPSPTPRQKRGAEVAPKNVKRRKVTKRPSKAKERVELATSGNTAPNDALPTARQKRGAEVAPKNMKRHNVTKRSSKAQERVELATSGDTAPRRSGRARKPTSRAIALQDKSYVSHLSSRINSHLFPLESVRE